MPEPSAVRPEDFTHVRAQDRRQAFEEELGGPDLPQVSTGVRGRCS
ncbi:hypothetical protein ACWDRR_09835 [Kitasatospora sp. NPDC003701]